MIDPARHYDLPPALDHRSWKPLHERGVLARGHTPGRCRACEAPAVAGAETPRRVVALAPQAAPAAPQRSAPVTSAPPRPVAPKPSATRPTTPVGGDRALAPTLRPAAPPAAARRPARAAGSPSTPCAVDGCHFPRQAALPSTHPEFAVLALLCARHHPFAREALRTGGARPDGLLAYLSGVDRREGATTTVRESILLALASLGGGPVAISNLVVRCWEREPLRFGLAGFVDRHPDAARVQAKLAGPDGLVGRGWCARAETGTVALTEKGRRLAAAVGKAGAE